MNISILDGQLVVILLNIMIKKATGKEAIELIWEPFKGQAYRKRKRNCQGLLKLLQRYVGR